MPASLAEALRLDLDLNLWEFSQCDASWYRELVGLKTAFLEGKRMAQETAQTIRQATDHQRRK